MSENPPKKKFRQASLFDMYKTAEKDLSIKNDLLADVSSNKDCVTVASSSFVKKGTSVVCDTQYNCKEGGTSDSKKSSEEKSMACLSSVPEFGPELTMEFIEEQQADNCPSGKNPMKSTKKKKKFRALSNPQIKGSSSSREGDHKFSWNMSTKRDYAKPASKGMSEDVGDVSPSKIAWRGCPVSALKSFDGTDVNVPSVHPSSDHSVMVKIPLPSSSHPPEPHPPSYSDIWDQFHVRMPCSPKSLYPVSEHGNDSLVPRWSIIRRALQKTMKSVKDLQAAIIEYNSRYSEKWNFKGLQYMLEEEFEEEESLHFFEDTLPSMIKLALDLPEILTMPPPLLIRHTSHSITLSQLQIASLLANAFFCTFPRRNAKGGDTEYASYPDINFNRLFFHKEQRSLEKLKCLINYFRRVTKNRPDGLVTFTRQHVSYSELPSWEESSHHIPELHISSTGLIEEMQGLLQVDFANKYIGGGVLGLGCVQEEIRFVLSPELLVSRLFTQVLDKTEALIITGTELFNCSTGYASTFCWSGSYSDETPCDVWKRRLCQVVAIDALHFTHQKKQYDPRLILRELNKAYAGFRVLRGNKGVPVAVATGNWGCGAFNGNSRLKSLIQLAACGYVGRDVAYFTFGDEKLRNDVATMHIFLKENNVTVGELVQVLMQYGQREWSDGSDLYQYIFHSLGSFNSDTDTEEEKNKGPSSSIKKVKTLSEKQFTVSEKPSARVISSYFKKADCPRGSASQSNEHYRSNLQPSSNVPATKSKTSDSIVNENLMEEKIEQVLKECERLVGDQKKKNLEHCSGGVVEKYLENNSKTKTDNKSEDEWVSLENMKEKIEQNIKASKSASEPSNLFSCLDEIDKQSVTSHT
ncbi:hypothetical protein SK128_013592 [Halocaridina rubra]|uniref:poly(ADP-ribose) glycohydrolase n=1 Tax=Halocaridina rubra TaxID=373956 RepID=A0AAN8WMT0_HALRR